MLDTPTSNVSRHLRRLEESLGVRLLDRTTRSQALTEAGERFYAGSQELVQKLEHMCWEVAGDDRDLKGRISVFAPEDVLRLLLKDQLRKFNQDYPDLEFEFLSGAMRPDLLHDRLDLILHPDVPADSSFISIKLFEVPTDFYASAGYLADKPILKHPGDLRHHQCIAELTQDRRPRPWIYSDGGKIATVAINAEYLCDSLPLVREMAECDYGVAMLPVFVGDESVSRGRLVRIFDGKDHAAYHAVYAIHSSRRLMSRKLQVFLDFLKEAFPRDL